MFDKHILVKEIMTRDVLFVSPKDSMDRVAEIFKMNDVHHLPVLENGEVVGIVSTTDLNKVMHHFTLFKVNNAESVNQSVLRSLLVKEVMTKPVATINQETKLTTIAAIFRENLFHALPVVNSNHELTGIITPFDLVNYAYMPDEMLIESD
jgi:CBS domain-containing protein